MFIVTLLFPLIGNVKAWYGEIDMLICHNSNAGTYISKVMFRDILNQDKLYPSCHCFNLLVVYILACPMAHQNTAQLVKMWSFTLATLLPSGKFQVILNSLDDWTWFRLSLCYSWLLLCFSHFPGQWILYRYTRGSVRGQCLVKTLNIGWHQYVSSDICRVNAKQTWLCCCSVVLC